MSCPCLLVTSPNSSVLYFCLLFLIFSDIFSVTFGEVLQAIKFFGAMEFIPSSLLKLLLSIMKKMAYYVVQEPDVIPGSMQCTEL